jgi:hemoglobin/transferrin/lactoferrin receptor protein
MLLPFYVNKAAHAESNTAQNNNIPQLSEIELPSTSAQLLTQEADSTSDKAETELQRKCRIIAKKNPSKVPKECQKKVENKPEEADIEITVTGTKTPRNIQDTPGTITVIDDKEIENNFVEDIKDLTRYEPGVSVRNRPTRSGNSSINIRGIEGNRVLIQVDGVRVPDIYSATNRDSVNFDSLKKVEILRGPASALYGSDAIGGVVSYTTKDPQDFLDVFNKPFYFSGKASYDSADRGLGETITLAGGDSKLSGLLQYTRKDRSETENRGRIEPNPQEIDSNNFLGKVVFAPNESNTFKLTGEFFESNTNTNVISSLGLNSFTRATNTSFVAKDYSKRGRVSLSHDYTNPSSSLFQKSRWQLNYQDSDATENVNNGLINSRNQSLLRLDDNSFKQQNFGGEAQFESNFSTGNVEHRLVYGIDLSNTATSRFRDRTEINNTTATTTKTVGGELFPQKTLPDTDTLRGGIFVQDEIAFAGGKVTLIPAIRYDYYQLSVQKDSLFANSNTSGYDVKDFSASSISPRLGIIAKITPELSAFAQYSRGFKSPPYDSAAIAFTNFGAGYTVLPNADLKPETSNNYEIGLKGAFNQSNFSLTGFLSSYENFIDTVSTGTVAIGGRNFSQFQNRNTKGAQIYGVEAKGEYRFSNNPNGLSLFGALAYAVGDNLETDKPLDSIDPFKAVVGLRYRSPQDVWGGELASTFVAPKDRVSDTSFFKPEGYATVDLRGYYNINPNTTLNVGIFNLFDTRYTEWADVRGVNKTDRFLDLYTQPGINIAASLTVRF